MEGEDKYCSFLLGITHFAVDFACTYLLTSLSAVLTYPQLVACALLYNGLAFAFQLPIGALGDLLGLHRGLAAAGCLLVCLGGLIPQPLALCILIGLGNACFHVGGGREALKRGKGRAGFVGRFVAPGALGIFLGPRLQKVSALLFSGGLAILAVALFFTRTQGEKAEKLTLPVNKISHKRLGVILSCMFLTVLLRSYMGTVLRYDFLSTPIFAFLFTVCIFAGKYFGGILSDRFGLVPFSSGAQLAGTVLLILSVWVPWLALPGIFLFNTSMAVTATALYRGLPRFPGTMFGLTTFALYLGTLPRLLGWENIFFNPWGLGVLCLSSAVLLVGGLKLLEGGFAYGCAAAIPGCVPGTDTDP